MVVRGSLLNKGWWGAIKKPVKVLCIAIEITSLNGYNLFAQALET